MNDQNVNDNTRKKIRTIMEQMGYENNELARGMVKGRINIVLVIVGELQHSSYALSLREIEHVLYEAGYMVAICISEYNTQKEFRYLQLANQFHFSGVILMTAIETPDLHQLLTRLRCPVVSINRSISQPQIDTVILDNFKGAYDITKYLIEMGHSSILHVSGPSNSSTGMERKRGYLAAMSDAGITVSDDMVYEGNLLLEGGIHAVEHMLERLPEATAVFAGSNRMAEGVMQGCVSYGVEVPQRVSVTCFDHVQSPELLHVPLTTVGNDTGIMGMSAAQMLLKRIEGDDGPTQILVYPCEIVEGKSVKKLC
jgi:LacI family transcriptional regulator